MDKPSVESRHLAFAHSYIANNFNAGEAYRETYGGGANKRSDRDSGGQILEKPDVKQMVAQLTEKHLNKLERASQGVVKEMSVMAFSDIRNYLKYDASGNIEFKPSEELGDEAKAIKKITVKETSRGESTTRTINFELHDKNKPLEMMGKAVALFKKPAVPEDEKDSLTDDQSEASNKAYEKRFKQKQIEVINEEKEKSEKR